MGYGCWNASGLDPDSDPKTLTFDYAYTSEDEFRVLQDEGHVEKSQSYMDFAGDESRDEFHNWSSTVCSAGNHLAGEGAPVEVFGREYSGRAWAHYGDRYQYLHPAFYVGKAGVWWQEEPFMGGALCVVTAPQYHFVEEHDVWTMDDAEFQKRYHMSIDRYKASAERQSARLSDFMLSYMDDQMSAVSGKSASVGSGYMRSYFSEKQVRSLEVATTRLLKLVLSADFYAALQRRKRIARMERELGPQLAPFRALLV